MSKLRKPTSNFTMVPNVLLRDKSVSLKAKGIYALLYSKPDGWTYIEGNLIEESKDARDSFRSGMAELAAAGWMSKEQVVDDKGRFSHNDLRLHDQKQKPDDAPPDDGKPVVGESAPINTEEVKLTEQDVSPSGSATTTKARRNGNTRQRLAAYLGDNQQIPADFGNHAIGLGRWNLDGIDSEWGKFCDYHLAKGSVMLDWFAAWRTWCRNAVEFAARDSARSRGTGQGAGGGLAAAVGASFSSRQQRRGAAGGVDRSAEGGSEAGVDAGRSRATGDGSDIPF